MASAPVEELLGHVMTESGYREMLESSTDEEDQDRLANIEELLTAARQYDEHQSGGQLEGFLEQASLVNETDAWQVSDDRATLMMLHASKGLEFPVVFIIALEEGIVPHERSRENLDLVEEERRLLFVGITRAQEELELSMASYREFRGQWRMTIPSQFLMELPREEMQVVEPPRAEPAWLTAALDEPRKPSDDIGRSVGSGVGTGGAGSATLTTAAAMTASPAVELPQVDPDSFHQGMIVKHPQYGLGKVIALSGSGMRRSATVAFAAGAGQKKFMLQQSQLRPAVG